jgi:2-pyrone-4,6-dicarboxylate lactonase
VAGSAERPPAVASPPTIAVPAGACDSHFHIVVRSPKYPFSPHQLYDPLEAPLPLLRTMLSTLGIERGVLVHASCYGTDNRLLIDTLRENSGLRGIALVNLEVRDEELKELDAAGVRGIRIFARSSDGASLDNLEALARRIAPFDWHVEISASGRLLPELAPRIKALPTRAVLNHMARMDPEITVASPEFGALADLLQTGRVWVKLSAPYRMSKQEPPYSDMVRLGRAIAAAAPDRMVWATDWPNLHFEGTMPDAGMLLDALGEWVPVEPVRHKILSENAAELYRFPSP